MCIGDQLGCLWRTGQPDQKKKIASLFYSWSSLRNFYNLVFAKISPDEELFPFHNCGRKALSDVQVACDLAGDSRPTNTALFNQEDL